MKPLSDVDSIQTQIDHVSVPMFVADLCADQKFRIAAINDAHARLTRLDKFGVRGRTPLQILGDQTVADAIEDRYNLALSSHAPTSYREVITFDSVPMTFDTTLCHAEGDERMRLFGTALPVALRDATRDDLTFYTALVRNAVETISHLADTTPERPAFTLQERYAAKSLSLAALQSLRDMERLMQAFDRKAASGVTSGLSRALREICEVSAA